MLLIRSLCSGPTSSRCHRQLLSRTRGALSARVTHQSALASLCVIHKPKLTASRPERNARIQHRIDLGGHRLYPRAYFFYLALPTRHRSLSSASSARLSVLLTNASTSRKRDAPPRQYGAAARALKLALGQAAGLQQRPTAERQVRRLARMGHSADERT